MHIYLLTSLMSFQPCPLKKCSLYFYHVHIWRDIFQVYLNFLRRFYLFIYFQTEGKWERKRGRETSVCGCLSHAPNWGPGPQPRRVPWLGIEPATLWFPGKHSLHWAVPARARCIIIFYPIVNGIFITSYLLLLW